MLTILLSCFLSACVTTRATSSIKTAAELQQGKYYFEAGNYKDAMRNLLPYAADGNKEAQYAVGYMYYYGYGVTPDRETGYFWIKRSANQQYEPAVKALTIMSSAKR
ncbi:MAG: hypothetical protein A3F14_03590 [Gammaproteobacteria bacterium RIFCSPHIGHO2_12_FULL_43_28]|nr:MAG: hypothetical protein A3F14_03590 [Gammaproteobacteria bacterium RIFCSPHIGHO2_12_FULL_43_28]